jgi:hypothetical protein
LLPLLTKERVGVRFYKAFYESEMLPGISIKLIVPMIININYTVKEALVASFEVCLRW